MVEENSLKFHRSDISLNTRAWAQQTLTNNTCTLALTNARTPCSYERLE